MFKHRHDLPETPDSPHFKCTSDGSIRDQFVAWVPDDVIILKLETFLAKYQAKIVKVRRDFVQFQLGSRRFWPWSGSQSMMPFRVTIRFHREDSSDSSLANVRVEIRALSRFHKRAALRVEASEVLRNLRSCLIAHHCTDSSLSRAS